VAPLGGEPTADDRLDARKGEQDCDGGRSVTEPAVIVLDEAEPGVGKPASAPTSAQGEETQWNREAICRYG